MTENEAIRDLQYLIEEYSAYPPETGVSATVGSLQYCIYALKEIQQYREVGTVKECREAVEKQKPKKPRDIEYDYSYFICPTCGEGIYVSDNFESHKFCLNCGQAIRCPDENLEGMEDE